MNEPGGNGKDPWNRRDPEQGPPDLDEMFKKFTRILNKALNKGKGQSGPDEGGGCCCWVWLHLYHPCSGLGIVRDLHCASCGEWRYSTFWTLC